MEKSFGLGCRGGKILGIEFKAALKTGASGWFLEGVGVKGSGGAGSFAKSLTDL
jgi:hypothetical protein